MTDNSKVGEGTTAIQSGRKVKKSWLKVLVVIVVLAIVAIGAYWYQNRDCRLPNHCYSYKQLIDYQLPGTRVGHGMTFQIPDQFKRLGPVENPNKNLQIFSQTARDKNGKVTVVSTLAATSVLPPEGSPPDYLTKYAAQINKDPKSAQPQMKSLVQARMNPKYNVSVSEPKQFTNPNINSNALSADFTASTKSADDAMHRGKIIIAVGKSATYYFMVEAEQGNWDKNQATWQKIIDSIKIDQ